MTLKDFKNGMPLPKPIYVHKPYVILSKENVVLAAQNEEALRNDTIFQSDYYDDCELQAREHDLYLNDNTKIGEEPDKDKKNKNITVSESKREPKASEKKHYQLHHDFYLVKSGTKEEIINYLTKTL